MKITWRDGVTTLSTAGAIVLERAYFHNWDWPLISNMRWAVVGLAGLLAIGFVFSYLLDAVRGVTWTYVAGTLGLLALAFTGLGLYYNTTTDYVVLLMLTNVAFWMSSIVRHLTVHMPMTHSHV